jgi:hypothetical protein
VFREKIKRREWVAKAAARFVNPISIQNWPIER